VAKTISAYDMAVSDAIYGAADRYVSRKRLQAMLDHEFDLIAPAPRQNARRQMHFFRLCRHRRHQAVAKPATRARAGSASNFNPAARGPSTIIIHVRMLDRESVRASRKPLGIIGVNLIHGAFYQHRPGN
jgi:hypothetical protein